MLKKLKYKDGSWEEMVKDWERQCKLSDSNFADYFENSHHLQTLEHQCGLLQDIPISGVFSLVNDAGEHTALYFASGGMTNRIPGEHLRVRHFSISPKFDSDDLSYDEYMALFTDAISSIIELARTKILCPKIKIHFNSRTEVQLFKSVMDKLCQKNQIKKIETHGLWILIEH